MIAHGTIHSAAEAPPFLSSLLSSSLFNRDDEVLLTLERRERRETSGCVLHCAEARERERDADGRA